MHPIRKTAPVLLLLGLVVFAAGAYAQEPASAEAAKMSRWQSNLSIGDVFGERIGIVKSLWWYALPKIFAVGGSFDFVMPAIPMSLNVALSAPLPLVTPFVCAGMGVNLTHGGITNYGGGFRVRLGPKIGVVAEYRRYRYTLKLPGPEDEKAKVNSDYVGAGISWFY